MTDTVHIPVKTLSDARRLATLFDGSYFSITSKKGKAFLGEGVLGTIIRAREVGYKGLEFFGVSHIVEVPEASSLTQPSETEYSNCKVMMLLRHIFRVGNTNPYGVIGTIRDRSSDGSFRVNWTNGHRNCAYMFNQDIILIPE